MYTALLIFPFAVSLFHLISWIIDLRPTLVFTFKCFRITDFHIIWISECARSPSCLILYKSRQSQLSLSLIWPGCCGNRGLPPTCMEAPTEVTKVAKLQPQCCYVWAQRRASCQQMRFSDTDSPLGPWISTRILLFLASEGMSSSKVPLLPSVNINSKECPW